MLLLAISIAFLFAYSLLIAYYTRAWKRAPVYVADEEEANVKVSVIVPVRNEEANIGALLDALQKQTYPRSHFEIIVVDDDSTDATASIVQPFLSDCIRMLPSPNPSKKKAIETGIAAAKGSLIVTTDADCLPGQQWLQTVCRFQAATGALFIAAPVKFTHEGAFVQLFQALDFLTLQGITAASVSADFHAMCNGANLAYTKASFIAVNGFEGINHVATGDDMLLMHKIWKAEPGGVRYLKSKAAIVATQPMPTWKAFFMQRRRWASKTLVYDDWRIIAVLGFVYLLNCLFPVLIVAALFNSFYWYTVGGFWIVKTIIELPFVWSVARFYGEAKLLRWFFIFQPVHMIYTVSVGLLSQLGKYEWKGRRTK